MRNHLKEVRSFLDSIYKLDLDIIDTKNLFTTILVSFCFLIVALTVLTSLLPVVLYYSILYIFFRSRTTKKSINKALNKYEQDCLKQVGLLVVNRSEEPEKKVHTTYSFLRWFLTQYNINQPTFYSNSGKLQCESSKRRSLGDLYLLCKSYRPNTTIKEVLLVLHKLVDEEYISTSYCNTIFKQIYWVRNGTQLKNLVYEPEYYKEATLETILKTIK